MTGGKPGISVLVFEGGDDPMCGPGSRSDHGVLNGGTPYIIIGSSSQGWHCRRPDGAVEVSPSSLRVDRRSAIHRDDYDGLSHISAG